MDRRLIWGSSSVASCSKAALFTLLTALTTPAGIPAALPLPLGTSIHFHY